MSGRSVLGLFLLGALGAGGWIGWEAMPGGRTMLRRVGDHALGRRADLTVTLPTDHGLAVGNPVYTVEGEMFALVGKIVAAEPSRVLLELDPGCARRLGPDSRALAFTPDQDLAWVLRTLVPPDVRSQVVLDLRVLWEERQSETLSSIKPRALALVGDVARILRDTFPAVLEAERPAIQRFLATVRDDLYPAKLKPALDTVLFPQLEEALTNEASGIASAITEKINFGDVVNLIWTIAMDRVGIGDKKDVEKKLRALFEKAAVPVLKERGGDLAKVAFGAVRKALADERMKAALEESTWELVNHPDTQTVVNRIVDAWVLKNEPLMARLEAALEDQELRRPFDDLWDAAEPVLEKHLESILSRDDGEGMDHQLVRALRRVVLKDGAYLLLVPEDEGGILANGATLVGNVGVDR